jgi:3-phenylpropionate/trans-cinnamate dioxygenase ferredoxin component
MGTALPDFTTVAQITDLPPGSIKTVMTGDTHLALANVNGDIYAIEDVCSHDGGPLGEGEVLDFEVECPRHGARFDVRTGKVTAFPAVVGVRTFPVKVEGGDVKVSLEDV